MATGDSYISEDELAEYLRMDGGAASEASDWLVLTCAATSRWVEAYCNRDFNLSTEATARYFDVLRDGSILVDDIGDATITVATDNANDGTHSTAWDATDFQALPLDALAGGRPVDELIAVGSYSFPHPTRRRGLVKVTARWGWPTVPAFVKSACLVAAAQLYKRRESAEGVLGGGDFGLVRVGSRIDPDVVRLLGPHRHLTVGG